MQAQLRARGAAAFFNRRRDVDVLRPLPLLGQVGDEFFRQRRDLDHAGDVDAVGRVAGPVVILVIAREEEEDGDFFAIKRIVVARPVAGVGRLQLEGEFAGQLFHQRCQSCAGAHSANPQLWLGVLEPANHIEIDHRHGALQRKQGVLVAVVLGAEQAAFLAAEQDENEPAALAVLHGGEAACQLQDGGGARTVVVGAVMDFLFGLVLRQAALAAEAQMIVMGTQDDGFAGQGPPSNTPRMFLQAKLVRSSVVVNVADQPLSGPERGCKSPSISFSRSTNDLPLAEASIMSSRLRSSCTTGTLAARAPLPSMNLSPASTSLRSLTRMTAAARLSSLVPIFLS